MTPVLLREIVPRRCYGCFCLLHEIYQLIFCEPMRILWKHAILYEELYGLAACTENVEYSLHMPEDVQQHSIPDNYWCFMYERLMHYYKRLTTNMKALCKTFADPASQVHFIDTYLES